MPTNDDLQKAFPLLSCLQPDRAVAVCVLIDAYDRLEVVGKRQDRRPDADRRYKPIIPEENLPQYCIYQASEKWEKDQESDFPSMEPGYRPTADDRLIRYIKTLALESMDRYSRYAAVGVGCYLYTYRPKQISALAEDLFSSENIRRVKKGMFKRLERRFPGICNDGEQVLLETPGERQRALVNKSLAVLAPWYSCHTACATGSEMTFLETYFDKESRRPELERIHMLFDTACCGLARLVREYNSFFPEGSKMRLDDPENKLRVPKFSDGRGGGAGGDEDGGPPDSGERFNPSPLTPAELSSVRHTLNRNQRRRRLYQTGELRVFVDGEATATLTRELPSASLAIPHTASCVEVFGEDNYGQLLLAVFPLSCLEPEGPTRSGELHVTNGCSPAFEISISPAPVQSSDSSERLLRLECKELHVQADGEEARRSVHPTIDEESPSAEECTTAPHRDYWAEACMNFHRRLASYARSLTNGRTYDAEDLVQETACRALLYSVNPAEIRNPLGYLLRMMRNVWMDKWARQQVADTATLDEVLNTSSHPTAEPEAYRSLENKEFTAAVLLKTAGLAPREKLLLRLYFEGYEPREIAEELGEDLNRVRYNLNAVRAKVRYRLKAAKKGVGL